MMSFSIIAIVIGVVGVGIYAHAQLKKKRFDKLLSRPHPSDAIAAEHGYTVVAGMEEKQSNKSSRPQFPSEILAADLIPERWKVVEDVQPTEFKVSELEFCVFLDEDEDISNDVLRQRAVMLKGNRGLVDSKRFLENQAEIPAELQGNYLVFPGTRLLGPDGCIYVVCLEYNGKRWFHRFDWPNRDWRGRGRLARQK